LNAQLIEIWGRLLTVGMQGENQMDVIRDWWLYSLKGLSAFNPSVPLSWGGSVHPGTGFGMLDSWLQVWEPLLKLQMASLALMGMVSYDKYKALSDRAEALEDKVKEQAKTIERLRTLLRQTSGENNVVVTQIQDLIGQQSQEFKQLTESFGEYLKSSASKLTTKK
jgi:uncharacterized coiled-coil protein SlyX